MLIHMAVNNSAARNFQCTTAMAQPRVRLRLSALSGAEQVGQQAIGLRGLIRATGGRAHRRGRHRCLCPDGPPGGPPRLRVLSRIGGLGQRRVGPGPRCRGRSGPRSSTQPSKSAAVIALGCFSSGSVGARSLTVDCSSTTRFRHSAIHRQGKEGQGSSHSGTGQSGFRRCARIRRGRGCAAVKNGAIGIGSNADHDHVPPREVACAEI